MALEALVDGRTGQYTLQFKARSKGDFAITLSCNEEPIAGSPFPFICSVPKSKAKAKKASKTRKSQTTQDRLYRPSQFRPNAKWVKKKQAAQLRTAAEGLHHPDL